GLDFKTLAACGNFPAIACLANNFRPKKEEVISHGRDGSSAKLHRAGDDLQEQQASREPCNPFYFQRKNIGEIDNEIGIEAGKGEEERRSQHKVGKGCAEEKGGNGGSEHAN